MRVHLYLNNEGIHDGFENLNNIIQKFICFGLICCVCVWVCFQIKIIIHYPCQFSVSKYHLYSIVKTNI